MSEREAKLAALAHDLARVLAAHQVSKLCAEERRIVIRADGFPDDIVARVVHSGTRVCVKLFHSEAVLTSTSTGWVEPPPRKEAGE